MSVALTGAVSVPLVTAVTVSVGDSLHLDAVRDARGDVNEIRFLLKGDVETCHRLFREAEKEGDAVTQIQLSHALFGMKWGKDNTKDFSSLVVGDLEKFSYCPGGFALFNAAYDQAMGIESGGRTHDSRCVETFRLAANRGYLPAFLELKHKEWKQHTSSYGFAVQLRPFVGEGDRQLDYCFGKALKNGCQIGSESYYEGLYWMNQSCGISVKYPGEHESFKDFIKEYVQSDNYHSHYALDGFYHVGRVVLAPSREAWETFVEEKWGDVRIAPLESYLFQYDPEQIRVLSDQYTIQSRLPTRSFVESSTDGRDVEAFGEKRHGFYIYSLSIYQDHKEIGKVSVQEGTLQIHETIEAPEIQPVIEFIENVMTRTGSAQSAHDWLKQIQH